MSPGLARAARMAVVVVPMLEPRVSGYARSMLITPRPVGEAPHPVPSHPSFLASTIPMLSQGAKAPPAPLSAPAPTGHHGEDQHGRGPGMAGTHRSRV